MHHSTDIIFFLRQKSIFIHHKRFIMTFIRKKILLILLFVMREAVIE